VNEWEKVVIYALPFGIVPCTSDGRVYNIYDSHTDTEVPNIENPDEAMKIVENILEKRLTSLESGV